MSETLQESNLKQYGDHDEIITPQTIYSAYLKTINGISFTSREIDIIACMVRGRRPNNIASLLSIAVKNVENRIAGIKLKIGCGSQEGIIDFIEKSDKYKHINSYYSSLANLIEFEKALKKLSVSVHENISCSLIYDSKSKAVLAFIRQLKQHLQLANIHILKSGETYDDLTTLISTSIVKQHHIICCLSTALAERKPEILNIAKLNQEGLNPVIFISIDELPIAVFNALPETQSYINLTTNKNYYFLIIDMLEIFYPFKLDKYFEHFYAGCKSTATPNELTESVADTSLSKTKSPKWLILTCALLGFTCTIFSAFMYKDSKKTNIVSHDAANTISKIQATQICKLPTPCAYFTGREPFLKQIKQILKGKQKVVVVGYQGMGKTQLAYQYAKLNAKKYRGGTYLLKADTPQILINSIRSFAIAMGVVTENQINQLNDEQVKQLTVPLLQHHLENKDKMLLVLDNVSRYEDIKDLISTQFQKHDVLITSIRKQWGAWDVLELKVFDQNTQEAEKLILSILKHESLESAKKLAQKLGYYPLVITQAVNYLKNNSMVSIEDYIREYDSISDRRVAFLKYQSFEQNDYLKTAHKAFEISKKILVKELGEAYDLLKLCTCFSHDIIPISIFKDEIKDIYGVLEVLNKYSLIGISNIEGQLCINMHNILKDSTTVHMVESNEAPATEEKVLELFDQYLVYDFWDKKNIENVRMIMPHIDDFLNHLISNNSDLVKTKKFISILNKSGAYYIHCLRDAPEAIRLLEKAKDLAIMTNPHDKMLNTIMEDLATSYYYSGEYNKARQELNLVKQRNGATALSYLIGGHILYNECRYDEAEAAYQQVLKTLTSNNAQYLAITCRSLGLVYYRKSQFSLHEQSKNYIALSNEHLEKALEIHKTINSENLELAISKHAYGRTAIKLKDFDKAEEALSDALRIAKNYCKQDEDHYEALVIKRSYGHFLCMHKGDQFDEGLQYLQQALDGKIRLFKNKPHQAVIGTIELIVDVYAQNPKHRELRKLMPKVNQYLDNWTSSVQTDDSKHINKELMHDRIHALKETINKVNKKHKIRLRRAVT